MAQPSGSLLITDFPPETHAALKEVDDEGNGVLEKDELSDMVLTFAAQKKAAKEGAIALRTLPKELQPALKCFDVDGDGTVAATELGIAAQLYQESKNMVSRLAKAVAALLLVVLALVGTIVGLTAVVIEESKETSTDSSGITKVKGSDTPAASGGVAAQGDLSKAYAATALQLDSTKALLLSDDATSTEYSYTVTGWTRTPLDLTFHSARGDTIVVSKAGDVTLKGADGAVKISSPAPTGLRRLRWAGGGRGGVFLSTTGSFTLSSGNAFGNF